MPAPSVAYSQRDGRWAGKRLGPGPDSIGADGCYLTSQAMVLGSMGDVVNPSSLNDIYLQHGACFGDGCPECLHMEAPQIVAPDLVRAVQLQDYGSSPADLSQLANAASLVWKCVEFDLGSGLTHFAPVYDGSRGAQSTILDPWQVPASVQPITLYGADPTRSILKIITYLRWPFQPPTQEAAMAIESSLPVYPPIIHPGEKAYVQAVVNGDKDNAFLTAIGCDLGDTTVDLIWTDAKTGAQDPGASKQGVGVSQSGSAEAALLSGVRRGVIVNTGPGSVVVGCKVESK